jgi:hypothetical protein
MAFIIFIAIMFTGIHATSMDKSGNINADEIWDTDSVIVTGDLIVDSNVTLTIQPGVIVHTLEDFRINIRGCILAVGNKTDSIFFTGDDSNRWWGIHFDETDPSNDSSILDYCSINYCKLGGNLENLLGGGIYINGFSKIRVSHSSICSTNGSGVIKGGGIYCYGADPVIVNNTIMHNTINGQAIGGGICLENSNATLSSNIIAHNSVLGDSRGGGIACINSNPVMFNNLLYKNMAYGASCRGGAMSCDSSSPVMINNTIVNNFLDGIGMGAGISLRWYSSPTMINCILWGNINDWLNKPEQVHLAESNSMPNFYYCNIQEGLSGFQALFPYTGEYENNIDSFPLLADTLNGDYSLQLNSPCINVGTIDTTDLGLPLYDLAGNSRISGGRIDMGAYEYPFSVDLEIPLKIAANKMLLSNTPNPFNTKTVIRFNLPIKDFMTLRVYNTQGKMVDQLSLKQDRNRVTWQPTGLAAGIYTVKVSDRGRTILRKVLYVK